MERMWKDHSDKELVELAITYKLTVQAKIVRGILTNRKVLEEMLTMFEMKTYAQ